MVKDIGCEKVEFCELCYSDYDVQLHHAVFKSELKELSHCRLNHVYLCKECHKKLHKNKGGELDKKVKLIFCNRLESKILKKYITFNEIKLILGISNNATKKIVKDLIRYKEGFKREEIINICIKKGV